MRTPPAILEQPPARRVRSMDVTELCWHRDGTVSWTQRTVTFDCPFTDAELVSLRADRDAAVAAHTAAVGAHRRRQPEPGRASVCCCAVVGCEVNSCGVLAVGRCSRCDQAFCESHRARTEMSEFDRLQLQHCSECLAKDFAARDAERAEWAAARARVKRIVEALVAAGSPGADRSEWVDEPYGLFGRKTRRVRRDTGAPRWQVGPINFESDYESYKGMLDVGPRRMPDRLHYEGDWLKVLAGIEKIAARHGVVVPDT